MDFGHALTAIERSEQHIVRILAESQRADGNTKQRMFAGHLASEFEFQGFDQPRVVLDRMPTAGPFHADAFTRN
jgi:hypothetical protein